MEKVELKFVGPVFGGTITSDNGSHKIYKVDILEEDKVVGSILMEEDSKLYTELYLANTITLKRQSDGEGK